MPEEPRALTLFKIFADRASAELRRVRAERGIREREEKYRRIVETTGEGFLLLGHDLTIVDVNKACGRMLGYGREAIIGKTFIDFAAVDARSFLLANQQDLFSGEYNEFESVLLSREDRRVSVLVHSDTLRNDKGGVIGTMLFVTDITEQKKSLAIAGEFQKSMLPSESPDIDGFDIAGKTVACDEIGGDYFDYLPVTACVDDHFGVVVGDVTDHGATAALLMATARAFLRMRASQLPGKRADHLGFTQGAEEHLIGPYGMTAGLGLDFGQTHGGHFGRSEDGAGHSPVIHPPVGTEGIVRRHLGFGRGRVGQHDARRPQYIAHRENRRIGGSHAVVGFHPAPFIHFHPGLFQTDAVGVGRAPHRHQHGVHGTFQQVLFLWRWALR
jgi:PAS domain S-box-containing protein